MHYDANQPLVQMKDVYKTYKTRGGSQDVLKGVSLEIHRGEFVAIVGPSGSGKSTLINMMTGIDRPSKGEVIVGGQILKALDENQMAVWRGRNVGVVFQFFQLVPTLSVIENVMMPMHYAGTYRGQRRERALELLEQVDLMDLANKFPSQISGGQQQRAAIARALANDPEVLVGDEPTGNLDKASAARMFGLFERLVELGKTMVMVTHDRGLAGKIPRVIEVREGRILTEEAIDSRLVMSY